MQTIRILPTSERLRHNELIVDEVMAEDDSGNLQTKSIVVRVRNQRWIEEYQRRCEITADQLANGLHFAALYERAGLSALPASIDLLRSGVVGGNNYGMATSERQAAARLSYRRALQYLGSHAVMVTRVCCEDMPVIPSSAKRGRDYAACRAYAMRDLCAGLDLLGMFFGGK